MYVVYETSWMYKGKEVKRSVRLLGAFNSIDTAKQFAEVNNNENMTLYIEAVCKGDQKTNRKEFEAKYKYFTIDNFKRTWRYPLHCYSCEKEIMTNETYYELHGNTVSSYAKLCKDCYEKLKKEYDEIRQSYKKAETKRS